MFSCCAAADDQATTIEPIEEPAPAKAEEVTPAVVEVVEEPPAPAPAPEPVVEEPVAETNAPEENAPPAEEPEENAPPAEAPKEDKQADAIDELMASMMDDIAQISKKAEG
mmetsp:Transcript_103135/g.188241  ORF Transcript_103135/g.188241 Transcript_103135/m.188241 type:complete len:111 (-) Transcript_103135:117-449(-)